MPAKGMAQALQDGHTNVHPCKCQPQEGRMEQLCRKRGAKYCGRNAEGPRPGGTRLLPTEPRPAEGPAQWEWHDPPFASRDKRERGHMASHGMSETLACLPPADTVQRRRTEGAETVSAVMSAPGSGPIPRQSLHHQNRLPP